MELKALFDSSPLPYSYIAVPLHEDPCGNRDPKLKLFVNKVITELTTDVFQRCGFEKTEDTVQWNTSWGRQFVIHRYTGIKGWQKSNHFAGAFLIGRKDQFHVRMMELKERVGEIASFYPESYAVPKQSDELAQAFKTRGLWIVKPNAAAQGSGIYIVNSADSEPPEGDCIVQAYIERPLLITGRKFDVRLYALVTSVNPVRIYMHDSGLIRFATHKYDPQADITDLHTHLTNFTLNKDDEDFVSCSEDMDEVVDNSKWSIPFFIKYCKDNGIDADAVFREFDRVSTAALIAGMATIQNHHQRYVKHRHTSYEQFGIDIILDENMKASVMEINVSPAMSGISSKLDHSIKSRLMHDLLRMARIIDCDCTAKDPCPGIDSVDHECTVSVDRARNLGVKSGKVNAWNDPVFVDYSMVRDFVEEKEIVKTTGYRRTFPKRKTLDEFIPCLGNVSYADQVMTEWVKMPKDQRLQVISKNFASYSAKLARMSDPGDTDEM